MGPKLSHYNIAIEIKGRWSSKSMERIHTILVVPSIKALYLTSVKEWTTILWFLDFQKTRVLTK